MNDTFKMHLLNAQGKLRARQIGARFESLLESLEAECPAGREMSLVKTKLEEACMFAKKSIAILPENQEGYINPIPEQDRDPPVY